MKPDMKALAALAVIIVFVAALYYVSTIYGKEMPSGNSTGINAPLDEAFRKGDFIYGPQAWAPYASHLPMVPGEDAAGNNTFALMFVDLHVPSRPNNSSTDVPAMVEYSFKDLQGTAAFHVYGYNHESNYGSGISWTNRVEGQGSSGYYVAGGNGQPLSPDNRSLADNHMFIKVSNKNGPAYDDAGNSTYFLNFNKPGGGMNAMRISTDPGTGGQAYYTAERSGKFYITYDSGVGYDNVLLLVALNSTQPDGFELHLKSSLYKP